MVLDYKQMFDSECLFECMNDIYEAGVKNDLFALIYESNRRSHVAVQTPQGLSRREIFEDLVMQGDVIAPLISSLQVDTFGKECLGRECIEKECLEKGCLEKEVALILRESLFISSLLLNSEAWVNYTEKDVRILEQCDEILLTKILECDSRVMQ